MHTVEIVRMCDTTRHICGVANESLSKLIGDNSAPAGIKHITSHREAKHVEEADMRETGMCP
jgi:hypothetical protein